MAFNNYGYGMTQNSSYEILIEALQQCNFKLRKKQKSWRDAESPGKT